MLPSLACPVVQVGRATATIVAGTDECMVGTVTTAEMRVEEAARRSSVGLPLGVSLGAPSRGARHGRRPGPMRARSGAAAKQSCRPMHPGVLPCHRFASADCRLSRRLGGHRAACPIGNRTMQAEMVLGGGPGRDHARILVSSMRWTSLRKFESCLAGSRLADSNFIRTGGGPRGVGSRVVH